MWGPLVNLTEGLCDVVVESVYILALFKVCWISYRPFQSAAHPLDVQTTCTVVHWVLGRLFFKWSQAAHNRHEIISHRRIYMVHMFYKSLQLPQYSLFTVRTRITPQGENPPTHTWTKGLCDLYLLGFNYSRVMFEQRDRGNSHPHKGITIHFPWQYNNSIMTTCLDTHSSWQVPLTRSRRRIITRL